MRALRPRRGGAPTPTPGGADFTAARLFSTGSCAFVVLMTGAAVGCVAQLGTVRLIGSESFGTYAYVIAWTTLLGYVSTLGFHVSLLRLLPAYQVSGDWPRAAGVLRFALRSAAGVGIAVAIATAAAAMLIAPAGSELAWALLIGSAVVPLMALRLVGAAAVRALGGIITSMIPERILRDLLAVVFLAGAVYSGLAPGDAVTATAAMLAAAIFALLILRRFLIARRPAVFDEIAHVSTPGEWLRPAAPLTFIMLADTLLSRAGVLVLGTRGDTLEAGLFAVAFSLAMLTALPRMALSSLFAPTVSTLYARGDMAGLRALTARSAVLSLVGTLAVALPLVIAAPVLLGWFAPEFVAAEPVLVILVFGQLIAAAAGPQQHLLTMTGRERRGAVLMMAAAASALAGGALLNIPFGMVGVAVALSLSMIAWNAAMAVSIWRQLGLLPGLCYLRTALPGAALGGPLPAGPSDGRGQLS